MSQAVTCHRGQVTLTWAIAGHRRIQHGEITDAGPAGPAREQPAPSRGAASRWRRSLVAGPAPAGHRSAPGWPEPPVAIGQGWPRLISR